MSTAEIAIPIELPLSDLPHGISIERSACNYIEFAAAGRNWPIYFVSAVSSVALNLLASFIYDAIKHGAPREPKSIRIEEEEVRFDRGEIERVLRRRITIEQ